MEFKDEIRGLRPHSASMLSPFSGIKARSGLAQSAVEHFLALFARYHPAPRMPGISKPITPSASGTGGFLLYTPFHSETMPRSYDALPRSSEEIHGGKR